METNETLLRKYYYERIIPDEFHAKYDFDALTAEEKEQIRSTAGFAGYKHAKAVYAFFSLVAATPLFRFLSIPYVAFLDGLAWVLNKMKRL